MNFDAPTLSRLSNIYPANPRHTGKKRRYCVQDNRRTTKLRLIRGCLPKIRSMPLHQPTATEYAKISPIRDVVHNYFGFSVFERDVIDSKYFQRLHFVLQNSAAYTAYPSNKNSRFVHSLGVSHLCGRLFVHGLRNAQAEVLDKFLKEAGKFLKDHFEYVRDRADIKDNLIASWRSRIGNSARFLHNPPSGQPLDISGEAFGLPAEFIVNTLWLALKICGLAHDIGHLPMSHSFEHAIKDLDDVSKLLRLDDATYARIGLHKTSTPNDAVSPSRENPETFFGRIAAILGVSDPAEVANSIRLLAFHERRSLRILNEIAMKPVNLYSEADEPYRDFVFLLAQAILLSSKNVGTQNTSFLASVRDIVAGGLDADRLDYTLRDPQASGLEIGAFDLDRIVSNFTLCLVDEHFQFAAADNSVSAIESFFHQRYLLYTSLVYQRTAVRSKAVLREVLARLIVFAYRKPSDEITRILADAGVLDLKKVSSGVFEVSGLLPASLRHLRRFDDARLRTLLFDVAEMIEQREPGELEENYHELYMIRLLAETFLFRLRENLLSFGKGTASANDVLGRLQISDCNPFVIGTGVAKTKFRNVVFEARKIITAKHDGRFCLIMSELPPRIYKEGDVSVYVTSRGSAAAIPIERISPFLLAQKEIEKRDMDFSISFVGQGIRSNQQHKDELGSIFDNIITDIAKIQRESSIGLETSN